jgi:hypothetical protein
MATYRCYFFDAYGRIVGVETGDLPGDAEAIKWGADLMTGERPCAAVELWQLTRKVCRLERGD